MGEQETSAREDTHIILQAWRRAFHLTWWVPWTRLRIRRRDLTIWVLKRKVAKLTKKKIASEITS